MRFSKESNHDAPAATPGLDFDDKSASSTYRAGVDHCHHDRAPLDPYRAGATYEELYAFTEKGDYDGEYPYFGALVRDAAGNLFGTTESGGTFNYGTVFKVSKTGNETVLYNFTGGADGGNPYGGLTIDGEGNLYGTTSLGGDLSCANGNGCGIAFRQSNSGQETVLHRFAGGTDGDHPSAGLLRDAKGNLYGTTQYGGSGYGIVFKLDASGKYTVLHRFRARGDGQNPGFGVLVRDAKGNLYGTTYQGGIDGVGGAVFTVSSSGKEKVLHTFAVTDGVQPFGGLIRDAKGNLYGTTWGGGSETCRCGTVYRLDAKRNYAVLHRFTGKADGANPQAGLLEDAEGNLYGTASLGGDLSCNDTNGCGTVFKLNVARKVSVLHTFEGYEGTYPVAPLIRDVEGNFYGTTNGGGFAACDADFYGCGVVFKITP